MASEDEKPTSSNSGAFSIAQNGDSDQEKSNDISLPAHVAGSGSLDGLVGTARDYGAKIITDDAGGARVGPACFGQPKTLR